MSKLKTFLKPIEIRLDAPNISSDGGLLLLGKVDEQFRVTQRVAGCLTETRKGQVVHGLGKMVAQRILGISMGWEDCNDFDTLCDDPLYCLALKGRPASQPTLSRFENAVNLKNIYRMSEELVEVFVERHLEGPPKRIVLDIDATDDPAHGQQQLEGFNAFYGCHCYLPLLVFGSCDGAAMEILAAVLRPGNSHSGRRASSVIKRLAERLKAAFPDCEIILRADAGFASPELYTTCEKLGLGYAVAMSRNQALNKRAESLMAQARAGRDESGQPCRFYDDFLYSGQLWAKKERRIVYKAEALPGKDNARFVVTNLGFDPQSLYEFYCGRGDSENRIKEMKLDLASGRTSCTSFTANAFRLMLHAFAFVLLSLVRSRLSGTDLARCTLGQIRLKLLKIAAILEESARRFLVRLPRGHPYAAQIIKLLAA